MSNLPPPFIIHLQYSALPAPVGGAISNPSLIPFGLNPGQPLMFDDVVSQINIGQEIKERWKNFISRKFEIFNTQITENHIEFLNTPTSRRLRVVFLPVKFSGSYISTPWPSSLSTQDLTPMERAILKFYITTRNRHTIQRGVPSSIQREIPGAVFPGIQTAFLFIKYQVSQGGTDGGQTFPGLGSTVNRTVNQDYIAAMIGQLFRVSLANINKRGANRDSWSAINRNKIFENSSAFSKQWYKTGSSDPFKIISSKARYLKTPTPKNIANKSQYGDSLVLTKQRLITRRDFSIIPEQELSPPVIFTSGYPWNSGYDRQRDYVIRGMIGHNGDVEILKILLDAGTYRFMHVHLRDSMVDLRLGLMDPMTEVPKDKNKLDLDSIKSECANKISDHGYRRTAFECFGLDKNQDNLVNSSSEQNPSAIEFTLKKRTFVYISVSTDPGGNPNPGDDVDPAPWNRSALGRPLSSKENYSSVGKYAIAMINKDIKNVSNDFTYPSCYMHWALDPDPITDPERKINKISILENGELRDVAFYLQEKKDERVGGLVTARKFNTVINGKLISSTSPDAIKYITRSSESPLFMASSEKEFYLFIDSRSQPGQIRALEFYVGGITKDENSYSSTSNKAKHLEDLFIQDQADVSDQLSANSFLPEEEEEEEPPILTPTPTVTPSETPTPTVTPSETPTPTVTPSETPTPTETPTETTTPTETESCSCDSRRPTDYIHEIVIEDTFFSSCPSGYTKGSAKYNFYCSTLDKDVSCVNCYPDD
jgi:hypothetical protein